MKIKKHVQLRMIQNAYSDLKLNAIKESNRIERREFVQFHHDIRPNYTFAP